MMQTTNFPSQESEMNVNTHSIKNMFEEICGLVVRVPGYRSIGPGLIPGATRFSEK
jgi:hypothetical protein